MAEAFEGPSAAGGEPESAEVGYDPSEIPSQGDHSAVALVLSRNDQQLLAIDGVEGVGIGRDRIGDDAVVVYVRDAVVSSRLPSHVEGYPVEVSVTGIIDAY